jgi:hypothetical protein
MLTEIGRTATTINYLTLELKSEVFYLKPVDASRLNDVVAAGEDNSVEKIQN